MSRLNWDAAMDDLPRHPDEPSIAATEGYHGVALPERAQGAAILPAKYAIELGVQLIALGETVQQIEDNIRLATLDNIYIRPQGQSESTERYHHDAN